LTELLDAGFIPAYVRIHNRGDVALPVAETDFVLSDGTLQYQAIPASELPHEFEHFSPVAVGANVYNTGVVVISAAALMGVIILAAAGSRGGGGGNFLPSPHGSIQGDTANESRVYNETTKTTALDYRDYLLTTSTIDPRGVNRGLVFFRVPSKVDVNALQWSL